MRLKKLIFNFLNPFQHNHKHVLTACQDRNIRVYTVANGKHSRTFKGSAGEDGTLIKVALDRSGMYAATSCTDKTLAIYDYINGECMATMFGHSELVTGLKFSNDCKHLISVSGTIFKYVSISIFYCCKQSFKLQTSFTSINPSIHQPIQKHGF